MMYFHNLNAFVAMGGYAWYVWPAYFIALLILIANAWFAKRNFRKIHFNVKNYDRQS